MNKSHHLMSRKTSEQKAKTRKTMRARDSRYKYRMNTKVIPWWNRMTSNYEGHVFAWRIHDQDKVRKAAMSTLLRTLIKNNLIP